MSFQSKKKRNAKASLVMSSKYTGPVKNDYMSVHEKLAFLRSSFKPQGGWHVGKSLIDSHMEAHKQRVESAKACVDTSTPKAMADSTKGKRVWVDGTLKTSTVTGKTGQPLQSKNRGKVVRFIDHLDSSLPTIPGGSAERTDSDGISPGSEPNNGSPSTGASDISEATESKVEDTYLTRTARLTAAYKERQNRKCECKVAKAHSAPLPWRPVYPEKAQFKHYPGFSFSCLQSIDQDNLFTPKKQKTHRTATKVGTTSTCSLSRQQTKNSPGGNPSPSSDKGSQQCAVEDLNRTFLVEGGMPITGVGERSTAATSGVLPSEQSGPGSLSSGTPYTEDFEDESEPDMVFDSDSGNQSEEDSPPVPLHSVDATSNQHAYICPAINAVDRCGKNSGMTTSSVTAVDVTSGDMMDSLMLSKDATSNDMRRNVSSPAVTSAGSASMQRESDYLAFIARVTQDILARGVYTDAGLKLLFEEHTERNRQLLDMNEMKKRIQLLTQSLNMS